MSYLVLLAIAVTAWVGVDTIVSRFADTDWSEFNNRRGAWADAIAIASIFPLTGTGLNTYGVATLFYQQHDLDCYYREAHNDYLQLAAEGGCCWWSRPFSVSRRLRRWSGSASARKRAARATGSGSAP